GDITDVALDDPMFLFEVAVADALDVAPLAGAGCDGNLVQADAVQVLQCSKQGVTGPSIREHPDLPKFFPAKVLRYKAREFCHERVGVKDSVGFRVDQQNAILR